MYGLKGKRAVGWLLFFVIGMGKRYRVHLPDWAGEKRWK